MPASNNPKKRKKKKTSKQTSFFRKLYRFVSRVVVAVNAYATRTDERGPSREYRLFGRKVTFAGFMSIVAGVLLIVILATNDRSVSVDSSSVIVTGLPDDFEGYRILLISDLGGRDFGQEQSTLMRVIDNLKYNAVVLAGDMIGSSGNPQGFYHLIEQLGTKKPVYFIAGDNDPSPLLDRARDNSAQTLTLNQMVLNDWVLGAIDRGAIYLDSPQSIKKGASTLWLLPDTFLNLNLTDTLNTLKEEVEQESESLLLGIEDSYDSLPFTNYRYNIVSKAADIVTTVNAQDLILMLSHEVPSDSQIRDAQRSLTAKEMKSYFLSPDLVLGGHYCGGEWKIPGIGAIYINAPLAARYGWFPNQRYVEGERTVGSSIVYVTPGLSDNGNTVFPFRLMNAPKVSLITLTGELPSSLLD